MVIEGINRRVDSCHTNDRGAICLCVIRHQQAAYRSGFAHGVVDGASTDDDPWYISQWGNGFAFHSREFINGYINGFCSIPANKNVGSDDDTAEWTVKMVQALRNGL